MKPYEECLTISRRIISEFPETPQSLQGLSISLGRLGSIHMEQGDLEKAKALFDEARSNAEAVIHKTGGDKELGNMIQVIDKKLAELSMKIIKP